MKPVAQCEPPPLAPPKNADKYEICPGRIVKRGGELELSKQEFKIVYGY